MHCCRIQPAAFRTPVRVIRPTNLILSAQKAYACRPSFTRLTLSPVGRGALTFVPLDFRLRRDEEQHVPRSLQSSAYPPDA
jgi:hypothetical protein